MSEQGLLSFGGVWVVFGPGTLLSGLAAFSLQGESVFGVECSERAVTGLSDRSPWQVCVCVIDSMSWGRNKVCRVG